LKQLGDNMVIGLTEATAAEEAGIVSFDALVAAKKKELGASTAAIEKKSQQVGDLGVEIAQAKNDLSSTEKSLAEDKKFLADLKANCAKKTSEWGEITATRAEEIVALADTIKILTDDDALELFKATLPSSSASFMQVRSTAAIKARALAAISEAKRVSRKPELVRLDLISLALRGKKIGFEKIIKMVDDMVALLKKEQLDDDEKKVYCNSQFDVSDDKKKALERSVADEEASMAKAEGGIATLKEEMEALQEGIAAMDKSVVEATDQRKEEHKAFTELMSSDKAAKELLGIAKNRLQQFYNPKLYKPPAKVELSADDRIVENMRGAAFAQVSPDARILVDISAHSHGEVAPPPPPAAVEAYAKKGEENAGVIAMVDLLVKDLDKEMTEAATAEKDAQADYAGMMKDSAEKRFTDAEMLAAKTGAKANMEVELQMHAEKKTSSSKELVATLEFISSMHAECDWLIKYFDVRQEARAGEVESLTQAKAVLSGADYS